MKFFCLLYTMMELITKIPLSKGNQIKMARLAADIDTRSFSLLCIAHWYSGWPTAPKVLGSSPKGEKNQLLCTGNHRMICMHWYSLLFLIIDQRFIDIANFKVSLMFFS